MNFDVVIIIYLLCLSILFIYFLPELIKSKLFSKIILVLVLYFAIIFPFIIAGYIRPQLIIIPFISVLLSLFIILNKLNILKKLFVKILLIIILLFWVYWGIKTIINWNTAFSESKKRMSLLVKTEFNKNTKPLIIGNLARTCQYFMFDNLLYSYNYWKYKRFVLEDTIYREISTVALNFDSVNSQIKYSKINNNEFEITTAGPHQFFNIGEYLKPAVGDIIRDEKMEIEILKNDFLGKTTKLRFKILSDDYEVFLFNGYELIKL